MGLRHPRSRRALSCAGALVAWLGAMPVAIAQVPAKPAGHAPALGKPGGGVVTGAAAPSPKKLLDDGKRLMALRKYADACPKIAESQKLDPKATTLFSLAQCREKAGDLAGAIEAYREMAATAAAGGDAMLEKLARSHIDALAAKLASITITLAPGADVPGLDVKLDGKSVPRASLSQPMGVGPGSHVLEATAPKKVKWSTTVEVGAAGPATATVPALADDAPKTPTTGAAARTDLGPATAASDAPVRAVGDARWTDNAGFVRPGAPPPAPQAAELPKLPPLHAQTMNRVELYFGGGRANYAYLPSSLDTAGLTKFDGWTIRAGVGAEYRAPASLFGVFWDVGGTIRFASSSSSDVVDTNIFNPGVAGRVGLDFHPGRLPNVAIGAFGGYWFESYAVKVSTPYSSSYDSSSATSLGSDKGPEYGVHLRLRTKESPEDVPVLQVDGSLTQKVGSAANGTYLGLRASLGGGFRVFFFVEDRIGRSGTITDSYGTIDAFAASHPLETDFGLGIGGLL